MTEEKIQPEENLEESPSVPAAEAAPEAKEEAPPPEAPEVKEAVAPPAEEETAPPAEEETPPPAEEDVVPVAEEVPPAEEEEEPAGEEKKKKIRHLTLEEVEKKLARSRIKMGGEASVYVRHLQARRRELTGEGEKGDVSQ